MERQSAVVAVKKVNSQDKARKRGREYFGSCLFCLSEGTVGAHIFPAGAYPQFKCMDINIVALCPMHDHMVEVLPRKARDSEGKWTGGYYETRRKPWSRIRILIRMCQDEHFDKLRRNLKLLRYALKEYKEINGRIK
jgi:hypothetical protein